MPDAQSQQALPALPREGEPNWLCFSDRDAARRLLGLAAAAGACLKGRATVTVADVRRYIAESEGVSAATLLGAQLHRAAAPVPCDEAP